MGVPQWEIPLLTPVRLRKPIGCEYWTHLVYGQRFQTRFLQPHCLNESKNYCRNRMKTNRVGWSIGPGKHNEN